MIPESKQKEIQKALKRGFPEGEIKEELKKDGYTEEEINAIFKAHKYDMRTWYLIFAVVFLITALYLAITISSYLFFIFSGLMFWVYTIEVKRLKNKKS